MNKFNEQTISSTPIFEGKVIKLQVDDVTLPDGNTSKREIVKHPGAAAVIAITKDKKIVFVEQYRKALEKHLVEIPAGKLEVGEKPETTAKRELEEETGYTTNHLRLLTSFYTSPGFADELVHLYITDKIELLQETKETDEDEFVEIIELTMEEAEELVKEQRIHDAKTAYAILYLQTQEMK